MDTDRIQRRNMEQLEKTFRAMEASSRMEVETFNDYPSDRATIWAADRIAELEAENARLREALGDAISTAEDIWADPAVLNVVGCHVSESDIDDWRRALSEGERNG